MGEPSSWFQQQLNEEAKRIGKSATDRLAIEIPTLPSDILQYFYQEYSIQMAASVISNRMLQYFMEQITAIIESPVQPVIFNSEGEHPVRSLLDKETNTIKISKMYEDSENDVIESVIIFLKMELQQIAAMSQARAQAQAQSQNRIQTAGGGMMGSPFAR
jgi:hypothetical protein